ncbi:hypothetical protein B1992_00435 [Pseudoxanthomonas broegbernensis]|uniref:DUF3298 domain-containing protein n=1 Tax=Pseudoxanthomonas broegbernensis TaxID=83619 RepID=A0A7V8GPS6_9GAMM|nr:DUF3298 and DUF4163 domain-containing protein [Pseudoxanthomonas broegbernensis]KAF1687942.1 hypothetical protein B1992_00435 [Pseudoxanthomonas broegbernensis]MBB6064950.1 hypothetical protein [Pseudoxanthomonas broegbernensis]
MIRTKLPFLVLSVLVLLPSACGRQAEAPAPSIEAPPVAEAAVPEMPAPVSMEDVIEHDPRYVVGISYPPSAAAYPGLASALHAYAAAARAELMQAVEGLDGPPRAPYELSLGFRGLMETPDVVAVAAEGSLYTGGAHGQPLVARFVWLPRHEQMLTSDRLLASPAGWRTIADHAAEQLGTAAHTRAADESLEPGDRQRLLGAALKTIAQGTEPRPENFAQFEPVPAQDGRIAALRFVFAPYQVGPYADGVQYAEVPAAVLLPYLAPDYRELFAQ